MRVEIIWKEGGLLLSDLEWKFRNADYHKNNDEMKRNAAQIYSLYSDDTTNYRFPAAEV